MSEMKTLTINGNSYTVVDSAGRASSSSHTSNKNNPHGVTPDQIGAVAAVSGKGLSTNDYTTDEKNKLAGINVDILAPKASPTFTGTPTAPTASADDVSTKIATTEFVRHAIDEALTSIARAEDTLF